MEFKGTVIACVQRGRDKGDGQKPLHTYLIKVGNAVGKLWSTEDFKDGQPLDLVLGSNNEMRFVVRVARHR